jgi:hypothetical protein
LEAIDCHDIHLQGMWRFLYSGARFPGCKRGFMKSQFDPSKRPESKPRPIRETKTKAGRANDVSKSQIWRAPSEKTVDEGWHPEEREHYRQERWYWRLTAILTFIAVPAAFATVVITQWTLDETRRATFETRRQANEAEKQTEISRDTAARQLRAYVFVDKVEIKINNRTNIETEISIKNGGPTTARHIESVVDDTFIPFPFTSKGLPVKLADSPMSLRLFGGLKDSVSIGPGGEKTFTVEKSIYEKTLKMVEAKKFAHVFYGAIYYDDVFGRSHFSKYCYLFIGRHVKRGVACREGNDSD